MTVTLLNVPNQTVELVTKDHNIKLALRQFRGVVFATIDVDGDTVVAGRRAVLDVDLLDYDYLKGRFGSLTLVKKFEADITRYDLYNTAIYLSYAAPTTT